MGFPNSMSGSIDYFHPLANFLPPPLDQKLNLFLCTL